MSMTITPPGAADIPGDPGKIEVLGRTVRCTGEFDASNCGTLRTALDQAATGGPGYLIDLTGVTFVDSSVLAVLFDAAPHRPALVVVADSMIDRIFQMIGLAAVLEVRKVPTQQTTPGVPTVGRGAESPPMAEADGPAHSGL